HASCVHVSYSHNHSSFCTPDPAPPHIYTLSLHDALPISPQAFTHNGKTYPAHSYIIRTNQAFRPHILDMFEAQDHPNDFEYAGGPPIAPYDAAGWTLAYLMHINFDRAYEDLAGNFTPLPYGEPLIVMTRSLAKGKFLNLSNKDNESFRVVNDLIKQKVKVYKTEDGDF